MSPAGGGRGRIMKAITGNNLEYNKRLKENAHTLRYKMTKAEACLWKYALSRKQMHGHTFNRQRPVLGFVADFFCKELKLIIEVDGYSHLLEDVIEKDRIKQKALEKAGFKVLRFTDSEVLTQINRVRQVIWDAIESMPVVPPPAPSSGGHIERVIYTETKDTYSLKASPLISHAELNKGLWLVLAGLKDVPPHIALISDAKYYSVSVRNVKAGEPVDKFLKAISRHSLPTLFVAIKAPLHTEFKSGGLQEIFESYTTLGNGEHTCHWPIRDFFVKAFSHEFANVDLVFELLALAQHNNMLNDCKSIYVNKTNSVVALPKYTAKHIRTKINSILKVNE